MNKTIIQPTKNHSLIIIFSFSLLTHDFHDSVSQEGSTALQVAEAFDIQRPHVGGGVAVGHPLCQVPAQQHGKRPLLLHSQSHLTCMPCTCQRATPRRSTPVLPHSLASTSCKRQARWVHPGQHVVAGDARSLAHQAAHVGGEGFRTVDQLMDLCWLQTRHSPKQGVQHWFWRERAVCLLGRGVWGHEGGRILNYLLPLSTPV